MPSAGRSAAGFALLAGLSGAARVENVEVAIGGHEIEVHHAEAAAEAAINLDDFPELCDSGIVAETCRDAFGREDASGTVSRDDLVEVLSTCKPSMTDLWKELGLSPQSDEAVSCTELCAAVKQALVKEQRLPPKSDVGCYFITGELVCDVDVRPVQIERDTRYKKDLPDYHDEESFKEYDTHAPAFRGRCAGSVIDYPAVVAVRKVANLFRIWPATLATVNEEVSDEDLQDVETLDGGSLVELGKLSCDECRSFGLHSTDPFFYCKFFDECKACSYCGGGYGGHNASHGGSGHGGSGSGGSSYNSHHGSPYSQVSGNPCKMWFEPVNVRDSTTGYTVPGFDALVQCDRARPASTKLTIVGYEPLYFNQPFEMGKTYSIFTGTNTKYGGLVFMLEVTVVSGYSSTRWTISKQSPKGTSGGSSYHYNPAPTPNYHWPTPTPAPTPAPAPRPVPRPYNGGGSGAMEAWRRTIQQVNVKAIAYVETALKRFNKRQTQHAMEKWYGVGSYTDEDTRRKLAKILNSVSGMLGNVEYAMGPKCSPNTFAYVYPNAYTCSSSEVSRDPCTKNDKGQFIFYICQLTLDTHLGEQIETLTHEGSHHATALTDDVAFGSGKAYGRSTCERLAREKPALAIKNADNFCYYVQDVTDGV